MDAAPDRIQSLVWVELRRQGYEVSWEEAGDVMPEFRRGRARPYERRRLDELAGFCRYWRMTPRRPTS